jgi:imidazolonepropionase-like amidohydrolase
MTNLKKAISSGIKIAFGTDAGVYTHGLNDREFGMYVEAGMSELEAIRTATLYAIDLLGVDDRGVIEAGKLADLIAVEGNPLEDISVLENVSFVMKDGEIYKK